MTNLWAFLLQTLYVAGVGLLLLAIKTLLKDKLSPRWQYAVWAVLALRILLPAYTGKYYVLLPLPLWVETAKVMVEPHWASAYTNVYEATQVTSPIPWLTGAPVSLSDWLFLLYVVGVVVTLLWYLISWLRLCLLLRQGTPVPADVQEQIERIGKTYACKTCRAIELPGLPSPMVCGVFRPVLALPKGKALDDHVILHELLHLNYKDALQNVFWCFCRTLHWCNPIVRLLLNRVGNDMESLCDLPQAEMLEALKAGFRAPARGGPPQLRHLPPGHGKRQVPPRRGHHVPLQRREEHRPAHRGHRPLQALPPRHGPGLRLRGRGPGGQLSGGHGG